MKKILHIVPHLGGGAGRILSSISIYSKRDNDFEHAIITLEPTKIKQFDQLCLENGIKLLLISQCDIESELSNADIVQIDWWHHPLTSKFMYDYLGKIKTRLVIWSHISGNNFPYISPQLIAYPDKFIFSTPYSYENKLWTIEEYDEIRNATSVVVSSGLDTNVSVNRKFHRGFNVGYIGFLGYSKVNPNFVSYYESVSDIEDINIILVGDGSYGKELLEDIKKSAFLKDKVQFKGYSFDVYKELASIDVFAYPLNPNHTGTAENILIEAMAAGVVPVVLDQCTEKYLVENRVTGMVVQNIEEFRNIIYWLYKNPLERIKIGEQASEKAKRKYGINSTVNNINKVYYEALKGEKSYHDAEVIIGDTPLKWFLSSFNGNIYNIPSCALGDSKGGIKQYLTYFSYDKDLQEVIEKNEGRNKTLL